MEMKQDLMKKLGSAMKKRASDGSKGAEGSKGFDGVGVDKEGNGHDGADGEPADADDHVHMIAKDMVGAFHAKDHKALADLLKEFMESHSSKHAQDDES